MPLPPYIASKRAADGRDREDYQTMFAQREGAVAAPTAALHFTPDLISRLTEAGIATETLTLHVGAGTFLPVKAEDTDDHRMHRSEEHTSELQSLMRISYAVFCLKTKKQEQQRSHPTPSHTNYQWRSRQRWHVGHDGK